MAKFPGATQYPVRWWGFPTVRAPRRRKPSILMVVHQTGNARLPSAIGEATYSNRDGSGASFTFVNNRDGSSVQCLDPVTQTPWTNGDLSNPNTSLPTVAAMVGSGFSPNEFCFMTAENVAYDVRPDRKHPITDAQKETLAQQIAWGHKLSGIPIRRSTVIGHADINSVSRKFCPTAGDLDKFLGKIITRAKEIVASGEEDPAVIEQLRAELAECKTVAAKRWRRIVNQTERMEQLRAELAVASSTDEVAELQSRLDRIAAIVAEDEDES